MIPLNAQFYEEENKVFCRFFYSNDRFILSPFLYVILLYSFSLIKTIERLREYISSFARELLFLSDVVFEIVVSFERFCVRENIETKATLLYP